MNNPSLLFVYRMAKDDDEVAARCVCCDVNSPESWNRRMKWLGVSLNTGKQFEFRLSVSDYSGMPEGPAEVYGEENCMKAVSRENWIPVRVSQNGTYIRINNVSSQEDCPFFLSLEVPTTPIVFDADVQFEIAGVHQLPEVSDYEQRMSDTAVDKWDLLSQSPKSVGVPFPIGCKFPATMKSGQRECGVVYELLSQTGANGVARIRVYASDRTIKIDGAVTFIRRFRNSRGTVVEVEIGQIVLNTVGGVA